MFSCLMCFAIWLHLSLLPPATNLQGAPGGGADRDGGAARRREAGAGEGAPAVSSIDLNMVVSTKILCYFLKFYKTKLL